MSSNLQHGVHHQELCQVTWDGEVFMHVLHFSYVRNAGCYHAIQYFVCFLCMGLLVALFPAWFVLLLCSFTSSALKEVDPLPPRKLEPFSVRHAFVVVVCLTTITLWAVNNYVENFLGGTGIVGLIPVVCFFATNVLKYNLQVLPHNHSSKNDFKELSWDVLMLLSGGLALGAAIQSSGLLGILAKNLAAAVQHSSLWVITLVFTVHVIWLMY